MPNVIRKTTGYGLAIISDTHTNQTANGGNMDPLMDLVRAHPNLCALLSCGDQNLGQWVETAEKDDFDDWIATQSLGSLPVLVVPGNHDTYWPISYSSGSDTNEPHGVIKARYPHLFKGKEWYTWDYESLRIVVMNNLTDDTSGNYNNCNPPYNGQTPNPDWSGFDTTDSEQQLFIANAFSSSDHLWKIGALHRPVYAPFDDDPSVVGRPTHISQRNGIIRTAILNGMSVLSQGDQHIRFIGKKYIQNGISNETAGITIVDDKTGVGCWPIINSGTYATNRAIDLSFLPGSTEGTHYLYASGNAEAGIGCGSLTILDFYGDMARIRLWECTDGETAVLQYDGEIWRNPA